MSHESSDVSEQTGHGPQLRRIRKVIHARATVEGAGVHLYRAIGFEDPALTDPFLLLDDFRSDTPDDYAPGFPWHPHRGMETITYVLRGEVDHQDSLGNVGTIGPGDLQWMTAGSGIIHQEMPRGDASGAMYGFQLWANLPASQKMMPPRYRGHTARELPVVRAQGDVRIRVIAGTAGGVTGPIRDVVTRPEYLDISVPAGARYTHSCPRGRTTLAYVIGGRGIFCEQQDPFSYEARGNAYFDPEQERQITNGHLVLFEDGDVVTVRASDEEVRFLLISGRPIHEPIAWRGPIVMNTQEELRRAFQELAEGTFIRDASRGH